jgi:septal ring factor EnvC (AmiA/AmiB activator)
MVEELQALEERFKSLQRLVERLRAENQSLRGSLANSEATAASLRRQIDQASQRLEAILNQKPEEGRP